MGRKPKKTEKSAASTPGNQKTGGLSQKTPDGTTILAFANFKGGVGKTTCAVNVAGCLAYHFHKKVLLIDLDVQASLSQWLLGPQMWAEWVALQKRTTYQIFVDIIMGAYAWNVPESTYALPSCPSLRISPATFEMLDLDNRLHHALNKPFHPKAFQCLDIKIKPVCGEFDYVIFDCPPNMYLTTQNAIFCADLIVIPTCPDFLSNAGIKRLVGHLQSLRDQFLLLDPDPVRIAGVAFNQYDKGKKGTMDSFIDDIAAYVREDRHQNNVFIPNARVFSRRLRKLSALSKAQDNQLPVNMFDPQCEASKDFILLTHEILEVIEA